MSKINNSPLDRLTWNTDSESSTVTLPSIFEVLQIPCSTNNLKLPTFLDQRFMMEEQKYFQQECSTFKTRERFKKEEGLKFISKEKDNFQKRVSSPVLKPLKMERATPCLKLILDVKTLNEVKLQERQFYQKDSKKSKWVFEENIVQHRGRKGKPKDWILNIKKNKTK
jgi:hypothetical protein